VKLDLRAGNPPNEKVFLLNAEVLSVWHPEEYDAIMPNGRHMYERYVFAKRITCGVKR
jgi:hypothetical protein